MISDAHEGLRKALVACFVEAGWQRCNVHFLRSATVSVPKQHAPAVLAVLKTLFMQPTPETARAAVEHALRVLEPTVPRVAALLRLTTAVLVEQDDEWQDGRRHFSQQSMAQLLTQAPALTTAQLLEDLAA